MLGFNGISNYMAKNNSIKIQSQTWYVIILMYLMIRDDKNFVYDNT